MELSGSVDVQTVLLAAYQACVLDKGAYRRLHDFMYTAGLLCTTLERRNVAHVCGGPVLLNPFPMTTDDPDELLLLGDDRYGYDWWTVLEHVHEAMIWAYGRRDDRLPLAGDIEQYRRVTEHVFQPKLTSYIIEIVSCYMSIKDSLGRSGHNVSRFATAEQIAAAGAANDVRYRLLLLCAAKSELVLTGLSHTDQAHLSSYIFSSVRVHGGVHFDHTLVVGDVVAKGDVTGEVWVLAGAQVSSENGQVHATVHKLSGKDLCNLALERGFLTHVPEALYR